MNTSVRFSPIQHLLILVIIFGLAGCAQKPALTPMPAATRDPNLEKSIVQQLEGMNPAAVPVYQEATKALDSGDLEKANLLYNQVIYLAPYFSTAYRRLGYIEMDLNHIDQAEQSTRQALALEPNAYNQEALAQVLLQKDTPKDSQEAFELATAAQKSLPDDDQTLAIVIMAAGAVNDLELLRSTDEHLLALEPSNPLGHYYAGLLAANDGKWEQAESELRLSQQLGMPADVIQKALDLGVSRNALFARLLRWGGFASAGWLLGFGLLFLLGSLLSRATLRAIPPTMPAGNSLVKPGEQRVRSIYRILITVLSLYYYVSIPFVILALFVVVGGIFYIFFLIGSFPVQLSFVLIIMLFASLVAVLRSLFGRVRYMEPGRPLTRMDAPELWKFTEDIANRLQIKPVDAIYISPFANISVHENGSILQKMRGASQRNLILGMGVLPALNQGQLAAILAHEYGHFSNRDTAGGNLAFQVYASLHQMAQRLIQGRAAQFFNPVWLFVVGYQRLYLRVTQGASRLQEILADRYAALAFGTRNFVEGLQIVIRQSVGFPLQANFEIRKSIELNRPISNIYSLPMQTIVEREFDKQLEEAMNRPTSPYDSHPAPKERIGRIEQLNVPYSPFQDDPRPASQLFPNFEALQNEMTTEIMKSVRK